MTIFERIDALQGFAHNEILSLLREIAVLAGADVSVSAAPIDPQASYTIEHVDAPVVDPVAEVTVAEVVATPVEPELQPLEAPAAAAVSEPIVTVTDV